MAETVDSAKQARTYAAGTEAKRASGSASSVTESEDTIRNLKATESVMAAFLAERFPTPPAEVAALITNQVKSTIKDLPLSQVANMTPGSGVLGTAAAAGVEQYLAMLNPAQREAAKVGVSPLDPAAMLKFSASLNQGLMAAGVGRLPRDAGESPASSIRYEGMNGLAGLTPGEKLTHSYAIQQGVAWAAENRDILKLGTGAIDIIKQTQLRKDTYEGLTKKAGLSSAGAVGISKVLHDKGEDANIAGQELTKNLTDIGDTEYTKSIDRLGKVHFKKNATEEEKEAAREDIRKAGEAAAKRHPGQVDKIKRTNKLIGAAVKTDSAETALSADKIATAHAKDAKADAKVAASKSALDDIFSAEPDKPAATTTKTAEATKKADDKLAEKEKPKQAASVASKPKQAAPS